MDVAAKTLNVNKLTLTKHNQFSKSYMAPSCPFEVTLGPFTNA